MNPEEIEKIKLLLQSENEADFQLGKALGDTLPDCKEKVELGIIIYTRELMKPDSRNFTIMTGEKGHELFMDACKKLVKKIK